MIKFFREKDFYYPFLIWIIFVCWYFVFVYNFFELAQYKTRDFFSSHAFYMFGRLPEEAEEIVIVAIDETCRQRLNLKWPWKRSITAQLIRNISSFSPKVIGLDIVFSGKSGEDEDRQLVSGLNSHPHIILAYKLGPKFKEFPQKEFLDAARGVGFVNKPLEKSRLAKGLTEVDKVIRSAGTFYIDEEAETLSLDAEIIISYLDVPRRDIKVDSEKGLFLGNKLFIPSQKGIVPLNYLVHYNNFVTTTASSVLEKNLDPELLKDKIVLVGTTDPLIHDEHLTPLGAFPGVAILANSLVMMLSGRFIYNLSIWQVFLIIFILGSLLLLLNKKVSFLGSSALSLLVLLAVFVGCLYLRSKDIQLDYFSLFFLTFSAYSISNIYKYSYLIYMRNRLRNLAIKDPSSGFYNWRYFLLRLDEALKDKSRALMFSAIIISNYRRLSLDFDFEQLQSLIKSFSQDLESGIKRRFKQVELSRLAQDIIAVAVWQDDQEATEAFFKGLLDKLKEVEFKSEEKEKTAKLSLQCILLSKHRGKRIGSKQIVYTLQSLLKGLKEKPQDFISEQLQEQLWQSKTEPPAEDTLDFLISDLEERNKELNKTLKELLESKKETEEAYFEVIYSLVEALEEKDTFTQGHSQRVGNYAREIARWLNLDIEECELIYKAALLHDIGKIGLADSLLHKKGKLCPKEMEQVRKHEIFSVEILKPIKAFKDLLPIVLHHHEYFDGSGYPHGLSAEMIPKEAQILAVADAFDAITTGRGYKKGKTTPLAMKELEKYSYRYNPRYIEALKKVLKI